MKKSMLKQGFTLVELLVVVVIIAVLASIALPVFNRVQLKGQQTKALSNARQIVMALKLYASDHNGCFPSYTLSNGQPTTTTVADSNTAFAQLFPAYLTDEEIFWVPTSAFCSPTPPDGVIDNPPQDTPVNTLKAGENAWAYVLSLYDTSDPALPVIAPGFSDAGSHTYTTNQAQPGGLWNGRSAVVIRQDSSGALMPVNQQDMTVDGPRGNAGAGDLFAACSGWLGATNVVVNPSSSAANTGVDGGGGSGGSGGASGIAAAASEVSGATLSIGNGSGGGAGSTGVFEGAGSETATGATGVTAQPNSSNSSSSLVSGLTVGYGSALNFSTGNTAGDTINVTGGLNMNAGNGLGAGSSGLSLSPGAGGLSSPGAGTLNLSAGTGGISSPGTGTLNLSAGGGSGTTFSVGSGAITISVTSQ